MLESPSIRPNSLAYYMYGTTSILPIRYNSYGNPILYGSSRCWNPHQYDLTTYIKFVAYYMYGLEQMILRREQERREQGSKILRERREHLRDEEVDARNNSIKGSSPLFPSLMPSTTGTMDLDMERNINSGRETSRLSTGAGVTEAGVETTAETTTVVGVTGAGRVAGSMMSTPGSNSSRRLLSPAGGSAVDSGFVMEGSGQQAAPVTPGIPVTPGVKTGPEKKLIDPDLSGSISGHSVSDLFSLVIEEEPSRPSALTAAEDKHRDDPSRGPPDRPATTNTKETSSSIRGLPTTGLAGYMFSVCAGDEHRSSGSKNGADPDLIGRADEAGSGGLVGRADERTTRTGDGHTLESAGGSSTNVCPAGGGSRVPAAERGTTSSGKKASRFGWIVLPKWVRGGSGSSSGTKNPVPDPPPIETSDTSTEKLVVGINCPDNSSSSTRATTQTSQAGVGVERQQSGTLGGSKTSSSHSSSTAPQDTFAPPNPPNNTNSSAPSNTPPETFFPVSPTLQPQTPNAPTRTFSSRSVRSNRSGRSSSIASSSRRGSGELLQERLLAGLGGDCSRPGQFIMVFDISYWAFWHTRYLSYQSTLVSIMQNHFPERLKHGFILNAPAIFSGTGFVLSHNCSFTDHGHGFVLSRGGREDPTR